VIRAAFPDIHYTLEDLVAEGDKVVLRWSAGGTHKGDFMSVAPTSKRVMLSGTVTFLIREGKIQEEWSHWDALGLLQQLGGSAQ
jgi:predicted ester cyclase